MIMETIIEEINYADLPDSELFEWPTIKYGTNETPLDLINFSPKVEPNFSRQLETVHTRTKVRI